MKWGNHLDAKIYPKTQRCYECNLEFETVLRGSGKYTEYEQFKVFNNQLSALRDFRDKVSDSITYLANYTPKTKDLQFFNEDGGNETWVDDTDRREVVLKDLREDLIRANEGILDLTSALKKVKYNPATEKKLYKLTITKVKAKENKI